MPHVNGSEFSGLKIRDYGTVVKISGWLNKYYRTVITITYIRKKSMKYYWALNKSLAH